MYTSINPDIIEIINQKEIAHVLWDHDRSISMNFDPYKCMCDELSPRNMTTFYRKTVPSGMIAERLKLHDEALILDMARKEMYYLVSLSSLIRYTVDIVNRKRLTIFTSDDMLPDIFLQLGFDVRKKRGHETGKYRALIEL